MKVQDIPPSPNSLGARFDRLRLFLSHKLPFWVRLAIILLAGTLTQVFVALNTDIGADEGNYLSGAAGVARGYVPIVDFPARDPGLMYYLAIGVRIFGANIEIARFQMILLGVATALLLALLARRLIPQHGDRAALLTAGIFLFVPFDVFFGSEVFLEPLAAFLVTGTAFLVLREFPERTGYALALGGLLLGAATLTRQSAVIVVIPFILYLWWTAPKWRARVRETLLFLLPPIALGGGYSAYIIERTDWTWFYQELLWPPVAGYINKFSPVTKLGLLSYDWMLGCVTLMLPLIIIVNLLWERPSGRRTLGLGICALTAIVGTLLWTYPLLSSPSLGEYGAIGPGGAIFSGETEMAIVIFALWVVALLVTWRWRARPFPLSLPVTACLGGWGLLFTGVDFSVRDLAVSPYVYDAAAPCAILIAAWLLTLGPSPSAIAGQPAEDPRRDIPSVRSKMRRFVRRVDHSPVLPLALVGLMVLSSAMAAVLILGPTNPINNPAYYGEPITNFRGIPSSLANTVVSWIRTNVPSNSTIFSFDDLFVTDAGLLSTPNLNIAGAPYFHFKFPSNQSPYPPDTFGLLPSAQQLLTLWNQTHLAWVVAGYRTSLVEQEQPLIGWYFRTDFYPVKSFGNAAEGTQVVMLERGNIPSVQPITWSSNWTMPGSPDAVSYDVATQAFAVGALNSSNLWMISTNKSVHVTPLQGVAGVDQLASAGNSTWVVPKAPWELGLLSTGSGFHLFNATVPDPESLVVDPVNGAAYFLSAQAQSATGLGPEGNILWSASLGCVPSTLTYLSASPSLIASCQNSSESEVLDVTNGSVLDRPTLAPVLVGTVSVPGILIGVNSSGGLASWNTSSWSPISQDPTAEAEAPLAPENQGTSIATLALRGSVRLLTAFDSATLLKVGNFTTLSEPSIFDTVPGGLGVIEASTEKSRVSLVQLPTPSLLDPVGPRGANFSINSLPLSRPQMYVWPGVYTLQSKASGYVTGEQVAVVLPGQSTALVYVDLGPEISTLGEVQFAFSLEVFGMAGLAFVMLATLVSPVSSPETTNPMAQLPARGSRSPPD